MANSVAVVKEVILWLSTLMPTPMVFLMKLAIIIKVNLHFFSLINHFFVIRLALDTPCNAMNQCGTCDPTGECYPISSYKVMREDSFFPGFFFNFFRNIWLEIMDPFQVFNKCKLRF